MRVNVDSDKQNSESSSVNHAVQTPSMLRNPSTLQSVLLSPFLQYSWQFPSGQKRNSRKAFSPALNVHYCFVYGMGDEARCWAVTGDRVSDLAFHIAVKVLSLAL